MDFFDVQLVALLMVVSFVIMQLIEALVKPAVAIINKALQHQPVGADLIALWPLYLSVGIAGPLVWFTGWNLFPDVWPDYPAIGRVITSLAGGLGPSFIYDLMDKAPSVGNPT